MDPRYLKLALLIGASLMMIPIGLQLGQRLKGGAKPMQSLELGPGRSLAITAEQKSISEAQLFALITDGETVSPTLPFARASFVDAPPTFIAYQHEDLLGLATELYPEVVVLLYDFQTQEGWPIKSTTEETDEALFARGQAMLQQLIDTQAAPDDAGLLESGFMPNNNQRLRENHEAEQDQAATDPGA